jgi:uncharacterized membrane protein
MPFCPSCGAPVEGRFCAKCGTSVEAATGGAGPSAGPTPPPPGTVAAGMEDNVAGALCYLLGFVTGVLLLVLEPYSKRPFVRFHAFQSILFCAAWIALSIALSIAFGIVGAVLHFLWFMLLPLRGLVGLIGLLIWLFLMYKAYNREWYQLPVVGPIAAKQAGAQ